MDPEKKDRIGRLVGVIGGLVGIVSGFYTFASQARPAQLNIFPHGIFDYAAPSALRCADKDLEFITAPLTLINEGGRSGIISHIEIELRQAVPSGISRRFIASAFGQWRPGSDRCSHAESMKHFSPIAIKGGESVRESVIFFPEPTSPPTPKVVRPNSTYIVNIVAQEYRSEFLGRHSLEAANIQLRPMRMVVGPYTDKEAENGLVALHSPKNDVATTSAKK